MTKLSGLASKICASQTKHAPKRCTDVWSPEATTPKKKPRHDIFSTETPSQKGTAAKSEEVKTPEQQKPSTPQKKKTPTAIKVLTASAIKDMFETNLPIVTNPGCNVANQLNSLIDSLETLETNNVITRHLKNTGCKSTTWNGLQHSKTETCHGLTAKNHTEMTTNPRSNKSPPKPSGSANKIDKAFLHLRKKCGCSLRLRLKVDTPQ